MNCNICPRNCNAERSERNFGICGAGDEIKIARAALHMWEEPPISGESGSGTIFFSGCNLKCIFCQNEDISHEKFGKEITEERLFEIMFELKEKGAHNINLVTPTHFAEKLIPVLERAKKEGLNIPILYNSSGYEKVETLKKLEGLIDIYMPDFKYWDSSLAMEYSKAKDYPKVAVEAISEMVRQQPKVVFGDDEMMKKGVLIRHMMLPGGLSDSKNILRFLFETYGESVYFSIMSQYTPTKAILNHPVLKNRVTEEEYDALIDFCCDLGMENAFTQEGEAADESFIPPFTLEGIEKNECD